MKLTDWEECVESRSASKIRPNKSKAEALIDISQKRIEFFNKITLSDENACFIFEGYYSSIIEMVHALALVEGYNIQNHICLGYYLRDVLKKDILFNMFDDCRFKRNNLIYYGNILDFENSLEVIDSCKKLTKIIRQILRKKL